MYLVNYHTHSNCSPDCRHSMTQMARAAIRENIRELCFTDHCDVVDIKGTKHDGFSWESVLTQFEAAKQSCADQLILRLGVELGCQTRYPEITKKVLDQPKLDFVIGSIHNLSGGEDFCYVRYTSKAQCLSLIERYLDEMLELAQIGDFDVLGHLSYPLRYMKMRDGVQVDFEPFYPQLEEIFKILIARGKGIELNTAGYVNNGIGPIPDGEILKLYKSNGGKIISIGSDAHSPERIQTGLREGCRLLKEIGFTEIAVFQNRKAKMITIEEE